MGEGKKRKVLLLVVCLGVSIFYLAGCSKEATNEEQTAELKGEIEDLKKTNSELKAEIDDYKEKIDELQQSEPSQDVSISKTEVRSLLSNGAGRFMHISAGGGIEDYRNFEHNGLMYRFLSKDFNNKEKIVSYLEETFTPNVVDEIIKELSIIERDGEMAQPDADRGSLSMWDNAVYKNIELNGKAIILELEVPLGDTGHSQEETVEIKYLDGLGWRINTIIY